MTWPPISYVPVCVSFCPCKGMHAKLRSTRFASLKTRPTTRMTDRFSRKSFYDRSTTRFFRRDRSQKARTVRAFVLFRRRNDPKSPYGNYVESKKPSSTVSQGTVSRANGVVQWPCAGDELYIMRRRNEWRAVNPSDRARDKNKTLVYTHNVCSVKGEDRFRLRTGQSEHARAHF